MVDNLGRPTTFVSGHNDNQAYAAHLIEFRLPGYRYPGIRRPIRRQPTQQKQDHRLVALVMAIAIAIVTAMAIACVLMGHF
jgi:hypothetical protein